MRALGQQLSLTLESPRVSSPWCSSGFRDPSWVGECHGVEPRCGAFLFLLKPATVQNSVSMGPAPRTHHFGSEVPQMFLEILMLRIYALNLS